MDQYPLSKKITFILTVVGFAMVLFGILLYYTDYRQETIPMDIGALLLALSLIIDRTGLKNWLDEQ